MKLKTIISVLAFGFSLFTFHFSPACQCPVTKLSIEECDKYQLIFRGKIKSDSLMEGKKAEVVFEILELYKGVVPSEFKVLFEHDVECSQAFNVGEEWIIYTNYKQAMNAQMDWCSRSRKYFKNEKLDFYTVTYGNDYDTELKFLRDNLGLHKVLKPMENNAAGNRNIIPTQKEFIIYLLISIVAILAFYYLFNKFFKW
ncbi:MAG: hypothetical protein IPJ32_17545 [Sphingobacteriaceae bacterium]|nr:hypothetical protein [Sphingobacteriaceae bacterium]